MTLPRFLAVAAALALAACASAPEPLPQAVAAPETLRVEMPVDPRDNGLTWAQIDLVSTLAAEYKARGHGPLVISYPRGATNADAALDAIAQARSLFYEAGLDWRQIAGGAYDASGRNFAPVLFSFTRYRAVAPDCPEGWEDLRVAPNSEVWERFGCATAANLAATVADPRDLVSPRGMDAPDAGRRQTVLDAYREGSPTASQRGDGENGAVSQAVQN